MQEETIALVFENIFISFVMHTYKFQKLVNAPLKGGLMLEEAFFEILPQFLHDIIW